MSLPDSPATVASAAAPAPRAGRLRPSVAALLATVLPFFALDQWTKWLVVHRIDPADHLTVVPDWFYLVYWTNKGAAWGSFQNGSAFFLALAVVALIVLTVLYRQGTFAGKWSAAGLCLLAPGILGNLADRVTRGHVVDFLLFDLHFPGAHPFPAFNVADSCICVAVGCFILGSWLDAPSKPPPVTPGDESGDAPP